MTRESAAAGQRRPPPRTSGLLLGLGLGGFADGIVLHQVLQWHHMVSSRAATDTVPGLEVNTLADGFFHVAAWLLVVSGCMTSVQAWRQDRLAPNYSFHLGLVLAGWGIFNVVEGVVDHHLLGLHHVRDDLGGPLSWDVGFLVFGVLQIAVGWALHRRGVAALSSRAAPQPSR